MDNKIVVFDAQDRFRIIGKKFRGSWSLFCCFSDYFSGHSVAGYACGLGFSPDGEYVISGDGPGNLCIWDWTTGKLLTKIWAHEGVCSAVEWFMHV